MKHLLISFIFHYFRRFYNLCLLKNDEQAVSLSKKKQIIRFYDIYLLLTCKSGSLLGSLIWPPSTSVSVEWQGQPLWFLTESVNRGASAVLELPTAGASPFSEDGLPMQELLKNLLNFDVFLWECDVSFDIDTHELIRLGVFSITAGGASGGYESCDVYSGWWGNWCEFTVEQSISILSVGFSIGAVTDLCCFFLLEHVLQHNHLKHSSSLKIFPMLESPLHSVFMFT